MDNTQRFGNRVEDYVKYRPHYPAAIVTYLQERFDFTTGTIADVGAGTGRSCITIKYVKRPKNHPLMFFALKFEPYYK